MAECDRRGLVVDVTLARDRESDKGRLKDLAAHQRAIETITGAIKEHRNWYFDLANERDVGDARYVPAAELKTLRELVRKLDPQRLVTASFGGHDLSEADLRESLLAIGLDFVTPHRPREPDSPAQTEAKTRQSLATMKAIGRMAPVHYQEPFRRGYSRWEPVAADFLTDLHGAIEGGAAGWCFHNGSTRGRDGQPYRSFDLHSRRLFEQLDNEERTVVAKAADELHKSADPQAGDRRPVFPATHIALFFDNAGCDFSFHVANSPHHGKAPDLGNRHLNADYISVCVSTHGAPHRRGPCFAMPLLVSPRTFFNARSRVCMAPPSIGPEPENSELPPLGTQGTTHVRVLPPALLADNAQAADTKFIFDESIVWARLESGEAFVEPGGNLRPGYRVMKRLMDIMGAIVALLLFSPILIPIFWLLIITTRGRPFYAQDRIGYCGRRFKMIKFRTMRLDAEQLRHLVPNEKDGPVFKSKNDPRITRIGNFLRRTSIDEMPQLFNVLLGNMSLVGPRPALVEEVEEYTPWQRNRLCVMPGLTCLWQVSGRSDLSFEEWVQMDLWYIRNQTLWNDIKLLLRTPWSVISMRGAY